jgi:hypothetical protein
MSVFSILKYHISYPPTADEMERLPADLYDKWLVAVSWKSDMDDSSIQATRAFIAAWYSIHPTFPGSKRDINLLIKMIREYDE